MGKNPLDRKIAVKVVNVEGNENHMQVFARLGGSLVNAAKFNSGAMHGTPGQRKGGKS